MLHLLTKYLLQYRKIVIPQVGTIVLVRQPAQLDIAEKAVLPPTFMAEVTAEEAVPDHQMDFLALALEKEKDEVWQALRQTGEQLHRQISNGGFDWKGIGLLRQSKEAVQVSLPGLNPVRAERVLRQDAEHAVLVGDQQVISSQMATLQGGIGEAAEGERSVLVVIGWILLVLSVAYIVFILYQNKFKLSSTGSRQVPASSVFVEK